ncbi:hypothetical protein NESM_000157300 [Novymonas esmeraldas]|uniref:Uncharacterized protein n=1 Tax=Novymonas esmeraldas TaxID=1808958 RepID=A0AAW0F4M5_9TRYP
MGRPQRATAAAGGAAPTTKTAAQLRMEVTLLEKAVEERKLLFVDLCEQSGTSQATSPHAAGTSSATAATSTEGHQTPHVLSPEDPAAEARRLLARNAFLRDELHILESMERQYANDPRVRDKRNEVQVVRMQIAQVEREIQTLQTVKKRRDKGLRAIGRSEEQTRRMRGQQHEVNAELREEVRQLTEELREAEKADIEVHDRCARLRAQVKLSVTDADVQELRQQLHRQDAEIQVLAKKEAAWRQRRASVREEDHKTVAKYRRECAKLDEEVERLQELLYQKDLELKRSYQLVGRYGGVSGVAVAAGSAGEPGEEADAGELAQ